MRICFLLLLFAVSASSALCAQPADCPGVDQSLTTSQRARDIDLLKVRFPSSTPTNLTHSMRQTDWLVLFATPAGMERGIFFYHAKDHRFAYSDTWGGVAAGDSAESIAAWTRTLNPHFPSELAKCFANAVLNGE